jgi:hypothetical protein
MRDHKRLWIALAGAAVLIAGHGVILYYVSSHLALSAAMIAAVIGLVVVKHLGLLGSLYAAARKTRWHARGIKAIAPIALIGVLLIALVVLHLTGHYPHH